METCAGESVRLKDAVFNVSELAGCLGMEGMCGNVYALTLHTECSAWIVDGARQHVQLASYPDAAKHHRCLNLKAERSRFGEPKERQKLKLDVA